MICRPCRTADHPRCVSFPKLVSSRCDCQHQPRPATPLVWVDGRDGASRFWQANVYRTASSE